jgi:Leucine-rich repeat (LRR) protein
MLKINKLFIAIAFMAILPIYAAQDMSEVLRAKTERISSSNQMQSLDENEGEEAANQQIISSDGKRFNVSYEVAMQSNFIKSAPEQADVIPLPVESKILKPLLDSMKLIYKFKNKSTAKELYEFVQQKLLNKFTLEELAQAFEASIFLYCPDLENVFSDRLAQIIKPDISYEYINEIIDPEHWHLIEKFIYLRSPELRPNVDKFSVRDIKQWNLSINDLVDYKEIDGGGVLDLSKFYFVSLDGLKRIPNINNLQELDLSYNQLTQLPANIFNGLNSLQWLYLANNQLTKLPANIFNGVNTMVRAF